MFTKPPLRKTLSVTSEKDPKIPELRRRRSSVKASVINSLSSHFEHEELSLAEGNEADKRGNADKSFDKNDKVQDSWTEFVGIHLAAKDGDLEEVDRMLTKGMDPDLEDDSGRSPLSVASEHGQVEASELLVKHGASVNLVLPTKGSALHIAVITENSQMVECLLNLGADVKLRETQCKRTALHFASKIHNTEILKILLLHIAKDPSTIQRTLEMKDKKSRTALHLSAGTANNDAVRELLLSGANPEALDDNDMTPIHACLLSHKKKRKCMKTLEIFLKEGQKLDGEGWKKVPLVHWVSRVGCHLCLDTLHKQGYDLNIKDKLDRTCLHIAALEREVQAFKYLVTKGLDPLLLSSRKHSSLHMAVLGDCPSIIDLCINAGCSTHDIDADEITPIQLAFIHRKTEAFQFLVKRKAVSLPEGSGENIIHYCSSLGSILSVSFLLDEGWDINLPDNKKRTPLHLSLLHGNEPLALVLINKGADLTLVDDAGATPLHYSVRWCGSDAVLRLLLKKNASLESKDRLGRTPLHYASSKLSTMSDLYILLDGKPKLNAQDSMGLTPLHLAARFGNESLVRILLDQGARCDLQDIDGFLPVDHAKEKNNKSITSRLTKHHTKSAHTDTKKPHTVIPHRNSLSW